VPISSFYGLQTSLRGLLAQQRALDTTGHNIANASTTGFSRQEAVMVASPGLEIPAGATANGSGAHLGSGVEIQDYRRVRDGFLDIQYRVQATQHGEQAGRAQGLDRAELALAEPSENGINTQLAKFWNSWSDLAKNPSDLAARQAVIGQARNLADSFATVDAHLASVRSQAQEEYDALTAPGGEVAGIAKEIAQLNDTIKRFVTAGDEPNDLMDRRDLLLDQLSKLGQVSVTDLGTGSIDVKFGGAGDPDLVSDTTVQWPPVLSAPSGRLGALRELASLTGPVQGYRDELDAVVEELATQVNDLHTAAGVPPFFATTPPDSAATLTVLVTAETIRTSGTTDASGNPVPGENDLALAVSELRGDAPDREYRAFVGRVGAEVRDARRAESNAEVLVASVDDNRQSVSGVSLDEEMSNLVRFQRSYQASARAMSTMDEMLDVLINRTGRVGL